MRIRRKKTIISPGTLDADGSRNAHSREQRIKTLSLRAKKNESSDPRCTTVEERLKLAAIERSVIADIYLRNWYQSIGVEPTLEIQSISTDSRGSMLHTSQQTLSRCQKR